MGNADKAIWLRYLAAGGAVNAPFTYDLRVGEGVQLPPDSDRMTRDAAKALTTKRIDVVWFKNDQVFICEVKPRAGASAIGQLINYRNLYRSTISTEYPIRLVLLTDQAQQDTLHSIIENDIQLIEVGI